SVGFAAKPPLVIAGTLVGSPVLNTATIWPGVGDGNCLSGQRFLQCCRDVVVRVFDVSRVGRRLVVDGSGVDQLARRIDDVHVRRGLRVIEVADGAARIQNG